MHDITMDDSKDLDVLIDARAPIIGIETTDEQRAPQLRLNAVERTYPIAILRGEKLIRSACGPKTQPRPPDQSSVNTSARTPR